MTELITDDIISFVDLSSFKMAEVAELVTDLSVNYTMDEASQVTISMLDPGFNMLRSNYFQIRRNVLYRGELFEVSSTEVSNTGGETPLITVECRPAVVQGMKRDKGAENYRSISASEYAAIVAAKYNLKLFVEQSTKKQNIVKSQNANSDESTWDVLRRAAGEAQFVCFVSNGTLFFCSQPFLLGKVGVDNELADLPTPPSFPGAPLNRGDTGDDVGLVQLHLIGLGFSIETGVSKLFDAATVKAVRRYQRANGIEADGIVDMNTWTKMFRQSATGKKYIPLTWPVPSSEKRFVLMAQPRLRRSDDDPMEGDGGVILERQNAVNIRAGQTVGLKGIPTFDGLYLVTSVSFNEGVPDPVEVSFRTPEKPKPEDVNR